MALTKDFSFDRTDIGTVTKTPLSRGLVINGYQVEIVQVKKSTGDTTGSFDLTGIRRPVKVICRPITNSSGTVLTSEPTLVDTAFTHTDNDTIAVSGLGNWTIAEMFVLGRSFT
jgi:hypothetical protein